MASCREEEDGGKNGKPKDEVAASKLTQHHNAGCCICCEEIKLFAVGVCDHHICYKCSARMRILSNQTYCATCRAEMKEVIISFQEKKFADFTLKNMKGKRKDGFFFEEWRNLDTFDSLFENACSDCGIKEKPFSSFEDLRTHIRRAHEKQFCQICLDALSNFPRELKMYTKKEMVAHRKEGDIEDRSHRGHPECKFCSDRFVDNDTLLLHLRKSHFWCHFCEHDGKQEYYNVYKDLRTHFGEVHFLCDEGECQHEQFTGVFRDKIDFQAHKLATHGKNFNKIQAKEARKIEFDYSYRKRQPTSAVVTASDYAEVQSSELKHRRGDVSNNRRDNRNKLNFSNFEDVEKEREELKRDKKGVHENVRNSPKIEKEKREMGAVATSNPMESQGYSEIDEDVIGLPEHINKPNDRPIRMQKSDDRSCRMKEEVVKSIPAKPELPVQRISVVQKNPKEKISKKVEHESSTEDFPLLPGGVAMPDVRLPVQGKQEDFPALGKSAKPKEPPPQKQPVKTESKQNGIVKKGKEKGKSWSQQSGRGTISAKNDFPMLQAREVNESVAVNKISMVPSNPGIKSYQQPLKGPPGYDKKVNERSSNTYACNGKGPPGFSVPAVRKKDVAPPGFSNPSTETAESNIRERNMRLVVLLQTYLDDFNLQIFKNISGEFRKNLKTASVYYSDISELLGDNLKYVFSELVALLPDEKKSEELLKLHRNAKILAKSKEEKTVNIAQTMPKRAVWGSTPLQHNTPVAKEDEIRCVDCGLTLSREDAIQHMQSHGEAFPSLPTATQTKMKYAPFKKVHQSQVRNPWTK